jgi:hypothetical protein
MPTYPAPIASRRLPPVIASASLLWGLRPGAKDQSPAKRRRASGPVDVLLCAGSSESA